VTLPLRKRGVLVSGVVGDLLANSGMSEANDCRRFSTDPLPDSFIKSWVLQATMRHQKKVWPEYFQKIVEGKKTYELRLADWECNEGDILVLQEWDPETKEYTGREVEKEVTYVGRTKNLTFWPEEDVEKYGFQIISFK